MSAGSALRPSVAGRSGRGATWPRISSCKHRSKDSKFRMEIRRIRTLRGSNTWAWFPVLEVLIDLQELKDSPSNILPGFNERVMSWLPSMIEHRCSIGERGGFFERLRRGTYQGHILEHVTLELQQLTGCNVGFGKARDFGRRSLQSRHRIRGTDPRPGMLSHGPASERGRRVRPSVRHHGRAQAAARPGR